MSIKCPYCNEKLRYEKQVNYVNANHYCYETWRGFCSKCNRTFTWDEVYEFSYCSNLEEEKELE